MFYETESNVMVAHFGKGDIMIMPSHLKDSPYVGTVSLIDNCGKWMPLNKEVMTDEEWTKWHSDRGHKTDEDLNTMIRLVFDKVESIDALIWGLQEARTIMTGE
uniref:Uncharacterized protein n=1 Tax=viral metagenome TaxID=1070528 RepID=A0A6M3LRP4_9ZZZZ